MNSKGPGGEFVRVADVALDEFHARRLQPGQVQLRPAPVQVVQADDAGARKAVFQVQRQAAAHETRAARDENAFGDGTHFKQRRRRGFPSEFP